MRPRPATPCLALALALAVPWPVFAAPPDPAALRQQQRREIVRQLAALDRERAELRRRLRELETIPSAPHPAHNPAPQPPPARGSVPPAMRMPAEGRAIQRWGAPTRAGPAEGLTLRTAARAPVLAGCNGRVLFAGPFRSYGRLLILDCGGTLRMVLGGLARLSVSAGRTVSAGETVGAMGDNRDLYLELRRDGRTVDPLPLLKRRS